MADDYLIFTPDDVDLDRSPLRRSIGEPTFVLGAFNPGLARLPGGNLLLMVRIAEALREPVDKGAVRSIRWTAGGYRLDRYPLDEVNLGDPRQFELRRAPGDANRQLALTSLSWLLPVELSPDARQIVAVHYDRVIEPAAEYQHYGIEDARIARIGDRYWMTVCSVSAERLGTSLYTSDDGRDWRLEGLVLDHQNKDMVLFEGQIAGKYHALTRPLGDAYFAYPEDAPWSGGPAIQLASSPDALHWKPADRPGIRPRKNGARKVGGGAPPILIEGGWLALYHGVETAAGGIGTYRTFWALLDRDDPTRTVGGGERPLIEADTALTASIEHRMYLPSPVVFTTGLVDGGDTWIVASGEADLACRITHLPKARLG